MRNKLNRTPFLATILFCCIILFSNTRSATAGCGVAIAQTVCTEVSDDIYVNPVFNIVLCLNETISIGNIACCGTVDYTASFVNGCTVTFPYSTTTGNMTDFTCSFSTPGTYQIVATFTGCGIPAPCGLCEGHYATFNIYVFDNSMISVNVSPTPVCVDQPVTITSSLPFPNNVSNTSVYITYGDGGCASTAPVPLGCDPYASVLTHVYYSPGTYTVTLTVNNCDCGTATATATVTVLPIVADFTAQNLCVNTGVQFTDISQCQVSILTWLWDFGDNTTSTAQNPFHTYQNPGTYTVTLSITSNFFGSTAIHTITVYPNPTVTVSSNVSVCAGQSTLLTASGANTYAWYPPAGLSSTTGASVTATPTSTTTYYVTGSSNGCTAAAQVTVTVNPLPVIVVSPNITICEGSSTVLTASGASSYIWSPSTALSNTTGASVTASPLSNITYTVIGTDANGCTGSASVIVTVTPIPIPVITGYNNNCINLSGASIYTVTNSNAYTGFSTWSPSSNLSVTSITTPNNPWEAYVVYAAIPLSSIDPAAQLCVTATAANGCTRQGCITVYDCCHNCNGAATVEIDNLYASEIFNTYPTQYASVISGVNTLDFHLNNTEVHGIINGDFIVDMDLYILNGKSLCMGPEAKITIQPGYTLYMGSGGNDPDVTILHAGCDVMWDGIYISDNSAELISTGAFSPVMVLKDARNAVVSVNGGKYQLDATHFAVNNKGMIVKPYSNPHQSFIKNSFFYSNTTPLLDYYEGLDLRPGLARTNIGIDINSVGGITIGDASSSNTNSFDNMDVGIWSKQSILDATNNSFTNIHRINPCQGGFPTPPPCAPEGYCILAQANYRNVSPPYMPALTVGTTGPLSNEFADADYGIYVDGEHTPVDIGYNDFDDVDNGVHVQHCFGGHAIDVYYNTMDKFNSGVRMLNNARSTITINNNDLNSSNTLLTPASYGIDVQEPLLNPSSSPHVNIISNTIKYVTTGITTTNLYGPVITGPNNIWFPQNHPTWQSYGIRLKNNSRGNTLHNLVFRYCTNISMNTPPPSGCFPGVNYIGRLYGISVESCSFSIFWDNEVGHLGGGIKCFNINTKNYFNCNKMGYCQRAFTFDNADPGPQGDFNANIAQDNAWLRDANFSSTFPSALDVLGINSPTGQVWLVQNPSGSLPLTPEAARMNPGNILFLLPGNMNTTCSALPQLASPDALQAELVKIIQYTRNANCPLDAQGIFLSQLNVYIELMNDQNLLNLGTSADAYLQAFFDSATATNIGEIANIKLLMAEEDYSNAENKNSSIAPEDQSQQNEKYVNEVYLATWAKDIYSFTQGQYETLNEIAAQNPLSGGPAVYTARVMLGVDYYDESQEERLSAEVSAAEKYMRIYPNPANNEVTIDYSISSDKQGAVTLSDVTGREVLTQTLYEGTGSITLSTNRISNGIYYVRVTEGAEIIGNEKLIIIK